MRAIGYPVRSDLPRTGPAVSETSESATRVMPGDDASGNVRWSILIATLARRGDALRQVLGDLTPQLAEAAGQVELVILRNHAERPLGHTRQMLVEEARGEYITFVDDDDRLPDYYVSEILPRLDGVDYVGWQMQAYNYGQPMLPTFHSLKYTEWWESTVGYFRDISHLNPVRKELAADFRCDRPPEDVDWVVRMRGRLKTEHYIDRVMYHYFVNQDSSWRAGAEPIWNGYDDRFNGSMHWANDVPYLRWHPEST